MVITTKQVGFNLWDVLINGSIVTKDGRQSIARVEKFGENYVGLYDGVDLGIVFVGDNALEHAAFEVARQRGEE